MAAKIPPKVQQLLKQLDDYQKTYNAIVAQKQQLQAALLEHKNALEAVKTAKENEVYKLAGTVFFKTDKDQVIKELEESITLLEARISTLEKQEKRLMDDIKRINQEIREYVSRPKQGG